MDSLPGEIILVIVEQMDTRTRVNFMTTCKGFAELICQNEKSISGNKAKQFDLPPTGDVLSSNAQARQVAKAGTFALVSELELRHSRIEGLLTELPKFIQMVSTTRHGGLGHMSAEQKARILPLMRRALWHCDAIADIATRYPDTLPEVNLDSDARELWVDQVRHEEMVQLFRDDPFRHFQARPTQIEYIKALSLEEQAVLILLVNTIGLNFARVKKHADLDRGPSMQDQVTMFEELVIRHGTWFLWGEICGNKETRRHINYMLQAGIEELLDWETDDVYAMPGLKMTLMTQFRERVNKQKKLLPKVYDIVRGLVGMKVDKEGSKTADRTGDADQFDSPIQYV